MMNGLQHAPHVTATTPRTGPEPERRHTAARIGKVRDRLVAAVSGRDKSPEQDSSGWYVRTGEGSAIAAGSKDLNEIDIDTVFGDKFKLALNSVAEVGDGPPGQDRMARLDDVYRTYERKLANKPVGGNQI
jgi:hypothetical protein